MQRNDCDGFSGVSKSDLKRALEFPTGNAFLNLGITTWIVYNVLYYVGGHRYIAYWSGILFSMFYLGLLTYANPHLIIE